jgi:hypothetical protein
MSTGTIIDEIERVPSHLTRCLDMLERWEARVSNELDCVAAGSAPDAGLARQLAEITKTSTSVAKEMRAWVGKVREAVDSLSQEDKIRVSLNLIQGLSSGDRLKTYQHISQLESARQDGGLVLRVGAPTPRVMSSGPISE